MWTILFLLSLNRQSDVAALSCPSYQKSARLVNRNRVFLSCDLLVVQYALLEEPTVLTKALRSKDETFFHVLNGDDSPLGYAPGIPIGLHG